MRSGHPTVGGDALGSCVCAGCWIVLLRPSGSLFFSLSASFAVPPQKNPPTPDLSARHTRDIASIGHSNFLFPKLLHQSAHPMSESPPSTTHLLANQSATRSTRCRIQSALRKYKGIPSLCQVLFSVEVIFSLALSPFYLSPQRLLCSCLISVMGLLVLNEPACKRTRYRPLPTECPLSSRPSQGMV